MKRTIIPIVMLLLLVCAACGQKQNTAEENMHNLTVTGLTNTVAAMEKAEWYEKGKESDDSLWESTPDSWKSIIQDNDDIILGTYISAAGVKHRCIFFSEDSLRRLQIDVDNYKYFSVTASACLDGGAEFDIATIVEAYSDYKADIEPMANALAFPR